jgi:alkanesulfonate monooxygenase SsuD/methylene tetrahydromethanopterin reductase-like flavin-dependent oxidoreductase (luciferase family)
MNGRRTAPPVDPHIDPARTHIDLPCAHIDPNRTTSCHFAAMCGGKRSMCSGKRLICGGERLICGGNRRAMRARTLAMRQRLLVRLSCNPSGRGAGVLGDAARTVSATGRAAGGSPSFRDGSMELFANLTSNRYEPGAFAAAAEAGGFDGVTCSDHYWLREVFPHLWVSLAAMACATERVTLAPSFANNLFRSPFEFAQASIAMQKLSAGRYEAGLGAGWTEQEMLATGQHFPEGRIRARMYREALLIVRELFATGGCSFAGEHYQMQVPKLSSMPTTPIPLVASVGGPWTVRNITPLVDRVELKFGRTTRGGTLDVAALASVTRDELVAMVNDVRTVRDDIPIGLFLLVAVGDDNTVAPIRAMLGSNLCGQFVGSPSKVVENLRALDELGIGRVQLTEFIPGSIERLSDAL